MLIYANHSMQNDMASTIKKRLTGQIDGKVKKMKKLEDQIKSWKSKTSNLPHWQPKIKLNERLILKAQNEIERIESLRATF